MSSSKSIFKGLNISNSTGLSSSIEKKANQAEAKENDFSYHEINKILQAKISNNLDPEHTVDDYTARINVADSDTKDFIYFTSNKPAVEDPQKFSPVGTLFKIYGLKFHISLPEDNEDMRCKGWEIIKNALISKISIHSK